MKVGAYAIVTLIGFMLAYAAAEQPSLITGAKWGVIALALMFAGAMGLASNKEDEE